MPVSQRRAPAHLLSGLLRCGCCGSGYSVHDREKTGKTRIRCSAVRESGACSNRRIVYLATVEQAVLSGLTDHLANPWLIEEYVDAYNAERQRLARTGPQELSRLQDRRDAALAELERVKRAFIRGLIDEAEAEHEMPRIHAELQAIEDQIQMIGASSEVIALEPATVARFHRSAEDLAATLRGHARERSGSRSGGSQAVADLRTLIETVTIHLEGPRVGFDVEVRGRLDELIGASGKYGRLDSGLEVVAREGFEPPTQGL